MLSDPPACDPETAIEPCPEPPPPGGGGAAFVTAYSPNACMSGSDLDNDGWSEECEYALAAAFSPRLRFTQGDGDPTRWTYFAVRQMGYDIFGTRAYIIYLLGYHNDTGWLGHAGDSEFLIVEIKSYGSNVWYLERIFMSAHWRSDVPFVDESRWYSWADLQYEASGTPTIYVAKGKHANYNSASRCNWSGDVCGPQHYGEPVLTYPNRNIGSSAVRLIDCVTGSGEYPGTECFWTYRPFKGWRISDTSAGAYWTALYYFEVLQ